MWPIIVSLFFGSPKGKFENVMFITENQDAITPLKRLYGIQKIINKSIGGNLRSDNGWFFTGTCPTYFGLKFLPIS